MRRFIILVFLSGLMLLVQAMSQASSIPKEVMGPYRAYAAALKSKDIQSAVKHSKVAWQQAETLLGDSKTTGDLAYNYGSMAIRVRKLKAAVKPLERGADLAVLTEKDGGLIRLEREVVLTSVLLALNRRGKAHHRVNAALEFAEANGLDDTVFAGEIMVHQARLIAGLANSKAKFPDTITASNISRTGKRSIVNRTQWRSAKYAQAAVDVFERYPQFTQRDFKAIAYKLIGFSHERDKEWLEAALAYQKAMEIQKQYLKFEDAALITTIGRWSNTRMHLLANMDEEEALEKGLCNCWPHEKSDVEYIVRPVKRSPPKMPRKATTSGFSFMKFDVDDAGKPINIEVLHSWPKNMYDKSSRNAIKKWKYTPRTPKETDEQRQGIRTVMRYILSGYYGGDPI